MLSLGMRLPRKSRGKTRTLHACVWCVLCDLIIYYVKNMHNVKLEKKNSFFLKKGKTIISIENRKFSRSRMTKRIAPLNSSLEI